MSGWKSIPLGDFAESVDYGVTASATEQPVGPKFLRITDIQNGVVNWENVPWCECDTRSASDARLNAGDIVFARTGATTGKSFLIRECPTDAVFASYLIRVRVGDAAEPRFISHFFQTPEYWAQIMRSARGAAQPGVNATTLKSLKIPLPPLPEQRRIAEILDKADALRAKRRAALAQLDTLTQSIFLDMFGDPATNPKGWPRVRFSELLEKIDSGRSPKCLDRPASGNEWGVLKLGAVTWCEYDSGENKALPPDTDPRPELEVRPNDLLFARKNTYELVAACALVRSSRPRLLLSDLIFRLQLRPDAQLDKEFLHQLLIYPTKRRVVQTLAGGSAGSMPNISKGRLEMLLIEVPPLDQQRRFAVYASRIEQFKTAHRTSLIKLDALLDSLRERAFGVNWFRTGAVKSQYSDGVTPRQRI
jgi:type I restriction enzyme S subunit